MATNQAVLDTFWKRHHTWMEWWYGSVGHPLGEDQIRQNLSWIWRNLDNWQRDHYQPIPPGEKREYSAPPIPARGCREPIPFKPYPPGFQYVSHNLSMGGPSWEEGGETIENVTKYYTEDIPALLRDTSQSSLTAALQWNWFKALGSGGYGTTAVWKSLDKDGKVEDVVVVKEVEEAKWEAPMFWHKRTNDAIPMPNEVYAMFRLTPVDRSFYTPRLIGYQLQSHQERHRIYMELCTYKDLSDLIVYYDADDEDEGLRAALRQHRDGLSSDLPPVGHIAPSPDNTPSIPEAFIWYVFECLAKACFAMEYGHMDYTDARREQGWRPMLHMDIKSNNVFLDAPDPDHFAAYPRPVLGDFGLALFTSDEDSLNPLAYVVATGQNAQYSPPEQRRYPGGLATDRQTKMSCKSNLYCVALIIRLLINCDYQFMRNPRFPGRREALYSRGPHDLTVDDLFQTNAAKKISMTLKELVLKCLAYNPAARPDLKPLIHTIADYIDHHKLETSQWPEPPPEGYGKMGYHEHRLYFEVLEVDLVPPPNIFKVNVV